MQVRACIVQGAYSLAHAFEMNSVLTLAVAVCAAAGANGQALPEAQVRTHRAMNTAILYYSPSLKRASATFAFLQPCFAWSLHDCETHGVKSTCAPLVGLVVCSCSRGCSRHNPPLSCVSIYSLISMYNGSDSNTSAHTRFVSILLFPVRTARTGCGHFIGSESSLDKVD